MPGLATNPRRAVVTGIGLVTPLGTGVRGPWEALLRGESGVGPITRFDPSRMKTQFAAEVRGFEPRDLMDKGEARKMDRFAQYGLAASVLAMRDAGLDGSAGADLPGGTLRLPVPAERFGAVLGVGMGGLPIMEENAVLYHKEESTRFSPFFIPQIIPNLAAGQAAIRYGLKGPCLSTVSACASALHAVGEGYGYIQRGMCDAVLVGGAEGTISPLAICGFNALRALSTRNESPETASRPFDRARSGFVMGEGGGVMVLEDLDVARSRGARIYAEVIGYGISGDGHHMTAPDPAGDGAYRCMKMALEDSGLPAPDYGYVNAHGTSTPLNDYSEVEAIKRLFGDHAYRLAVSSTKSSIGHLLGAAGGVEAIFTALSLHDGVLPPTLNFERADDPDDPGRALMCDPHMDYVPRVARKAPLRAALCNAFGFGGTNGCIALARWEG